jgi:hypothetical protein
MSMHLGRSKERVDRPDTTEFEAFRLSRYRTSEQFAAVVARNADRWIRARIASGRAGTRPPFMGHGEQARLLRVIVHPLTGAAEVRESEAAVLHRLGELTSDEEALYAAGELPAEHCYLSDQAQHDPGVRVIEAKVWQAMGPAERRAAFEGARDAGKAATLPSGGAS